MNISVIGCGRWGSFIAWYLDRAGQRVTCSAREGSAKMARLIKTRKNDFLTLPESVKLSYGYKAAADADAVVVSVAAQSLAEVLKKADEQADLTGKTIILCMKGIEITTLRRLSQVCDDTLGRSVKTAVWLGPGHVQEFVAGVPNCMVIDSNDEDVKEQLVEEFSSDLIRFYYGRDMIGNEIGAAAKNVIGIAAGMLDGMGLGTLKGALMSRGTREIARLISAMGGNELSAYGLCHLGDYEATVFSKYSHNRLFGESIVNGSSYNELAEGFYTAKAMRGLSEKYASELPICEAVYDILYNNGDPHEKLLGLFSRKLTREF